MGRPGDNSYPLFFAIVLYSIRIIVIDILLDNIIFSFSQIEKKDQNFLLTCFLFF